MDFLRGGYIEFAAPASSRNMSKSYHIFFLDRSSPGRKFTSSTMADIAGAEDLPQEGQR